MTPARRRQQHDATHHAQATLYTRGRPESAGYVSAASRDTIRPPVRVDNLRLPDAGLPPPGVHRPAASPLPLTLPQPQPVAGAVGRVNCTVAPGPSCGTAHNRPPCCSTIVRLIASPLPSPCFWG
jgi:hypothetical protein